MEVKEPKSAAKDFPILCVGGSAGGLDAYTRLLQNLPSDLGVAIVIVSPTPPNRRNCREVPLQADV